MIVTVTLNPALDKTAMVDSLHSGALHRLRDVRLDAGGKGINVSGIIHSLGGSSIAVGFAGGGSGEELLALIARKGFKSDFVHIGGITRTNLKVLDPGGRLTEFNEPGPEITTEEWQAMEAKLSGYGKEGTTVILSGSLPAGLDRAVYQKLSAMLRRSGAAVFLDADGESLRYALESPPAEIPDFIKPNRYELCEYFGIKNGTDLTEAQLVELCRSLIDRGIKLVALSMGEAGAVFVSTNGIWRAPAIKVAVRSTVGSGDSMTGALVYGFEQCLPDEQCFALALAASAGACTTEGTNPPGRALIDELLAQVRIEKMVF